MDISKDAVLLGLGLLVAGGSLVYVAAALWLLWAWRRRRAPATAAAAREPPVTILKPLCGSEPELYENLRSFCDQDYPEFQVVFGVQDPNDPARAVARRLAAEFPERDLCVVVDDRLVGPNRKASNLANMMAAARHAYLVVADSDIRVGRDYLSRVVGPLADPGVGVVTCLYRARPSGTVWSELGTLFINEWFLPSVLVARALGSSAFCFGSTVALRRGVLEAIGGFPALAPHLADDYRLGELIRRQGLQTVLSDYLVETLASEPSAAALLAHELRWMRTIRAVEPLGYAGSGVTYALPMSLAAVLAAQGQAWSFTLPLLALVLRLMLHFTARRSLELPRPSGLGTAWLVPVRDLLAFAVWVAGFFTRRVRWRKQELAVQPDGRVGMVTESSA